MPTKTKRKHKKFYTLAEANATLPLLRSILRDVTELAHDLRDRQERLNRLQASRFGQFDDSHEEEIQEIVAEFERGQERMQDYLHELKKLHVELKDFFTGLVDFPSLVEGREVYLCWRLGETEVSHWHELDAGFAGRQKIRQSAPAH